ncbi:malonic semialdehyde reductase [Microvirga sp. 2MCAF38]|uniref:malonic semialdehyde reductase n=1 Tax=Microvirga sp. 2MCAF38 TaxID=3232989 RepID=UPI003F9A77B0
MDKLDDASLDQLFRNARTLRHWQDKPIGADLLRDIAEMAKLGPTSGNCCPARFVFVVSPEAKERLKPHLDEGNVRQTMSAPATVIVGYDMEFYEKFPVLSPRTNVDFWRNAPRELVEETALRNSSLQGAYLMLAARAHGLDCGPMSGFDNAGAAKAFFPSGTIKANFLINLGYGDREGLRPRAARLAFEEFCQIA